MENAMLPTGIANEPNESAKNTEAGSMSPRQEQLSSRRLKKRKKNLADEPVLSQISSQTSYNDVLSQPTPGLTHRQKLVWLQKRRTLGLWVQCDNCDKWRYLPDVLDSHELPKKWYCRMNPDARYASCSVSEVAISVREEEDMIHGEYSAGSVVWARLRGWPWWPALVADCPDVERYYWLDGFSDIPTSYNVVFFDSTEVSRAWISPKNLKPYAANKKTFKEQKGNRYKQRLEVAMSQADDACKLQLQERLSKYSFIARYKGNLKTPKKLTKKELIKAQKKLQHTLGIEFPISEWDDESFRPDSPFIQKNVILSGTPKRQIKNLKRNRLMMDVDTQPLPDGNEVGDIEPSTTGDIEPSTTGDIEPSSTGDIEPSSNGVIKPSTTRDIKPSSNGVIKPSTTRDIEPSTNGDIEPSTTGDIEPSTTGDIEPSTTGDIEPSSNGVIKPSTTRDIKPSSNGVIKPSTSRDIEPSTNGDIEPSTTGELEPSSNGVIEPSSNGGPEPDSMQVQIGSTGDTAQTTEAYDNDTSKTYCPENEATESTQNSTVMELETQELQLSTLSPMSDDFEFNIDC